MSRAKPLPAGVHTVTPHLVVEGAARAIEFYRQAFGAREESRLARPGDGKLMHASIRIGDSTVMLCDDFPEHGSRGPQSLQGSPVTIHLYVADVDAVVARAAQAGATVTMPVADMFWGDRYGQLVDPFGHRWSVATHVRDVDPKDYLAEMQKMPPQAETRRNP